MRHEVIWTQPPPVWPTLSVKYVPERATGLQQPAILRFTTDSFMDDFLNALATAPERLKEYKVRPETWRGFTPSPTPAPKPPASTVLQHLRIFRRPAFKTNGSASAGAASTASAPAPQSPLKLYQPAHQRHYLVTSSLVCRVPGLPDRAVDSTRDERAGFVMRRLLPPADKPDAPVVDWDEHAWIPGMRGNVWRRIAPNAVREFTADEELLPMFGVNFDEAGRRKRRVFAGVVPAGKREAYLGAPQATGENPPGVTARTARKVLLRKEVIEPWKNLVTRAQQVGTSLNGPFRPGDEAPDDTQRIDRLRIEREQIQTVSWLILLDFARYLSTYLPSVWRAVVDPNLAAGLDVPAANVFAALEGTAIADPLGNDLRFPKFRVQLDEVEDDAIYPQGAVMLTLREALARYGAPDGAINETLAAQLENVIEPFERNDSARRTAWPDFVFPLADPNQPSEAPLPPALNLDPLTDEEDQTPTLDATAELAGQLARIDRLAVLVVRGLEDQADAPPPEPAIPTAAVAPADALEGWFVIRCVYTRPGCEPLHGAVVSEAAAPFLLAGYFDPDAPARPIRIGLPVDTTPAGLRKFDKNTAFVISNTLCGQIRRMRSLTFGDLVLSVLPWPFHKDLPGTEGGPCKSNGLELGMICSLSIPIITLCALILLMIMVTLFDLIFRWLPFFILCFPLPGLSAKKPPAGSSS